MGQTNNNHRAAGSSGAASLPGAPFPYNSLTLPTTEVHRQTRPRLLNVCSRFEPSGLFFLSVDSPTDNQCVSVVKLHGRQQPRTRNRFPFNPQDAEGASYGPQDQPETFYFS